MIFRDAASVNFVLFLRGVWFVKQPAPEPYISQRYIDHPTLSEVSSALALGGSRSAGGCLMACSCLLREHWPSPLSHLFAARTARTPVLASYGAKARSSTCIYALVSSYAPLTVYLYRSGFGQFTFHRFTLDEGEMGDRFVHLTNVAVQKTAPDYDPASGCKWELRFLKQYLISRLARLPPKVCLVPSGNAMSYMLLSTQAPPTLCLASGAGIPSLHVPLRISLVDCLHRANDSTMSEHTKDHAVVEHPPSLPPFPSSSFSLPVPVPRFLVLPLPFLCP